MSAGTDPARGASGAVVQQVASWYELGPDAFAASVGYGSKARNCGRLFGFCSSCGMTCRGDFPDGTCGAAIVTLSCTYPRACFDAATLDAGWPSITTPPK